MKNSKASLTLGLVLACAAFVFSLAVRAQAQTFTSLYSFCTQANCTDGKNPYYGSLVQASDGNLYGSTWLGGTATRCPNGCGTIFRITTGGSFTTVHAFTFTDGQLPYSGMIQATDGNLYGTTSSGGGHDDGTIYAFTPGIPPTPVQFVPLTRAVWSIRAIPTGPSEAHQFKVGQPAASRSLRALAVFPIQRRCTR